MTGKKFCYHNVTLNLKHQGQAELMSPGVEWKVLKKPNVTQKLLCQCRSLGHLCPDFCPREHPWQEAAPLSGREAHGQPASQSVSQTSHRSLPGASATVRLPSYRLAACRQAAAVAAVAEAFSCRRRQ